MIMGIFWMRYVSSGQACSELHITKTTLKHWREQSREDCSRCSCRPRKSYGKVHHKVDRFFASSKTCSCCGFKLPELGRGVVEWTCPDCGVIHDRDVNAAVNVHQRGLSDLYNFSSAESADYIRGEDVRPKVPAMPASWLTSVKRRATAGSLELAHA